jgi:glycosyltransferase involved in cell wall biosynthesis
MNIAQVAPPFVRVPPVKYGGTERVVYFLTEGLVKRGHNVTLFAAGTSETSARLIEVVAKPLWQTHFVDPVAWVTYEVHLLKKYAKEFDIIHSHIDYLPWLIAEEIDVPIVTTFHGRLDIEDWWPLMNEYRHMPVVSISDAQRLAVAHLNLNWVGTVYHGLDLEDRFYLGDGSGGYLLFLGRIAPEKGPTTAIRVAINARIPLKIAARVDPVCEKYFTTEVQPYLDHPLIHWIGEVDDIAKRDLLAGAVALLAPIDWDEPFGLAVIEALASGTPVIARPRGALVEIVRNGLDGYLCWDEQEMVDACTKVTLLDRSAIRNYAIRRFSTDRMVEEYEEVYERVIREFSIQS